MFEILRCFRAKNRRNWKSYEETREESRLNQITEELLKKRENKVPERETKPLKDPLSRQHSTLFSLASTLFRSRISFRRAQKTGLKEIRHPGFVFEIMANYRSKAFLKLKERI